MCPHVDFVEVAKEAALFLKRMTIASFIATTDAANKRWWEIQVKVYIIKAMPETSEDRDRNLAKSILVR